MAISSSSADLVGSDDAAQNHNSTRMTDWVLGALESWIDMRTRRERARLDGMIEQAGHVAAPEAAPARTAWWRSWRACTRRRGW